MDEPEIPPVMPVEDQIQSGHNIQYVPLIADKEMEEFQNEHNHKKKADGAGQEMNDRIIPLEHKRQKHNQGAAEGADDEQEGVRDAGSNKTVTPRRWSRRKTGPRGC